MPERMVNDILGADWGNGEDTAIMPGAHVCPEHGSLVNRITRIGIALAVIDERIMQGARERHNIINTMTVHNNRIRMVEIGIGRLLGIGIGAGLVGGSVSLGVFKVLGG